MTWPSPVTLEIESHANKKQTAKSLYWFARHCVVKVYVLFLERLSTLCLPTFQEMFPYKVNDFFFFPTWYKRRKSAVNEQSVYVYSCTVLPLWWKSNMCPSLRILRHFYLNFSVFVSQKSNVLTNEVNGCAIWVLNFAHGGKFEYILSCKLNFGIFLWTREREREVCLSAVVFFCKGDAICWSCLWHFDPEEGFISQLESTYLCWGKRTWWMNLLLRVLQ